METNLSHRIQATLLAVLTVGLVLLAVWNLRQESEFSQPDDGVWWAEAPAGNGLIAEKVLPDSPGRRAGLKAHDLLTEVNDQPVARLGDLERYQSGPFGNSYYSIVRNGISLESPVLVIPVPADRSMAEALRVIGLIYLAIGLYVLFRRWTAPHATHFYIFCLASFALYALKYTGKLNASGQWDGVDQAVFWGNVLA